MSLPMLVVVWLRNPFPLNWPRKFVVRKLEEKKNLNFILIKYLVHKPPSAADKVHADMTEGGREDWGCTHECKAL